jgi:hypothetical protein
MYMYVCIYDYDVFIGFNTGFFYQYQTEVRIFTPHRDAKHQNANNYFDVLCSTSPLERSKTIPMGEYP